MSVLRFQGIVKLGNDCRVSYDLDDELDGSVHVGEHDVVDEINDTKWSGPVTVAIADKRFSGDLAVELGWGYTEYTPMDSDALTVGPHNLIEIISRHEGEEITVWIADEPVDLVEAS